MARAFGFPALDGNGCGQPLYLENVRVGPMSTVTALDGPMRRHGPSRFGLLLPLYDGVVPVEASACLSDVDVRLPTLVRPPHLTR